jgi:serine/threonine-protein kinase
MSTPSVHEAAPSEFTKRYHVIAKLGEGGMALVHLAVVRGVAGVRKLVVLKSVRPELVSDLNVREMFLTEARLTAALSHPNIVQTFEVTVLAGRPVLVMEYLEGQSLSRITHPNREPMPLPYRLFVLMEILNGLEYVHALADLDGTPLNLIHRDVSPQNVFVTYDGVPKLLDFGIAKSISTGTTTEAGVIKGKVRYMAPEQLAGSANLDRRADVFAMGVLLWETITGRRLWAGAGDLEVMQTLVNGSLPDPEAAALNVLPALATICRKAIARDREDRYESAGAMRADLEAAIHQLALQANARQVGRFVSDMFGELRSSVKKIVEGQLKNDAAPPINLIVSDETDAVASDDASTSVDIWAMPSAVTVSASQGRAARRRRRRLIGATTGALTAVGAVIGSFDYLHHDRAGQPQTPASASSRTAAVSAPEVQPVPPPRNAVHLRVEVSPPAATLFLDDSRLDGNPFEGDLTSDGARHTIRAEAQGYRSESRAVDLTKPLELVLQLEPLPASVPLAADPKHHALKAPTPNVPSCNPPFYFDESGIKRIKLECVK